MKLTQTLLEWVLTSAFLILAVTALRALLGRRVSAGLRYALWAVVLARLLVPVQLFTTPVAGTSVLRETGVEQWVTAPTLLPDSVPAVSAVPAVPSPTELPDGTLIVPQPNPAPATVKVRPIPVLRILGGLWLAGTAATGAAFALSNLRFARRLRRVRVPLEGADCPLPVYLADDLPSPCLFGLFRPAVYLTSAAASDPAMLRHVLAHEITHFRHRDHLWNALRGLALAVHWWDPLVWLAAALSRRDCELACDEGALKRLGDGERIAYGRTLLALITVKPRPGDLLRCSTTMTGGQKSVFDRMSRIAKAPKRWLGAAVLTVALAALACVCAFGSAADPEPWDPAGVTADLTYSVETGSDGSHYVRIDGTVDGVELTRGAFWNPDWWHGDHYDPELTMVYPPFTDGVEGHIAANWEGGSGSEVTIFTRPAALSSSSVDVGYWVLYVDLDSGTVQKQRMPLDSSPEGGTRFYPASISDEEAVKAARVAAKLLTEAADRYKIARDWIGWDMDLPALRERFPADMDGVPEDVVRSVGEVVQRRATAYLDLLEKRPLTDQPIRFDGWRVQNLTGPWRGTDGERTLEVWQLNYEFHTTTPDLALNLVNGGAYLDEDGWLCPTYPNCTYAVFLVNDTGKPDFLTDFTDNGVYPDGDPDLFFARVRQEVAHFTYSLDPLGRVEIGGLDCGGAFWQEWQPNLVLTPHLGLPEEGMGVLALRNPRFLGGYFADALGNALAVYFPSEGLLFLDFDDYTNSTYDPGHLTFIMDLNAGTVEHLEATGYPGKAPAFSGDSLVDMGRTLARLIQGASDHYFSASRPAPEAGPLPFDQPLTLWFGSGAGAWRTLLTLHPDGAFEGHFSDSEMGGTGKDFPFGTQYLCTFHGRFGAVQQTAPSSWSLTLEELELDTGHPLEERWIEEGVQYISAAPAGFTRRDGRNVDIPLQAGARFTLYAPDAKGFAPGDELYGMRESDDYASIMYQFWTWWPDKRDWTPDGTLGSWGLCNMATGDGFFGLDAWGIAE